MLFRLALVLSLYATAAMAHTVWLEPLGDQLVARFAEPGDDFETSPGHLDSLSAPIAFMLVTNAPAPIVTPKKSNHFAIVGASATNIVCLESIFTVRGGRKPHFYGRWQPVNTGAANSLLTLDIVPTGQPGEARAFFRTQPLGRIKATLRTPDGKEQELTADGDGFLRFTSKQPGLHLLMIAHHRESLAGFHGGRSYQQTSHNAALSWVQP